MQKRIFFSCFLILLSLNVVFFLYFRKSDNSIVYVDSNQLFSGFKMTKELKNAGEKELRLKNAQIDSLQTSLKLAADDNYKSFIIKQLISKKQEIDEFEKEYAQLNSEKIWSRIDAYTKDFGEAKGYDFIIGSNGKGQLFYGKKEKDVTKLLLNYINKKYEGF